MKALLLHPSSYKKTMLCKPVSILVLKRSMQRISKVFSRATQIPMNTPVRSYATKTAFKLDAPDSNDGAKKKHTHVGEEFCVLPSCGTIKCPDLCDQRTHTKFLGHHTHKPPVGRMCKFISELDANGDEKPQYFVKYNGKKEMTEEERQQKGNGVKPDPKKDTYVKSHSDKYD